MQATPRVESPEALTEVLSEFLGRLMCGATQQTLGALLSSEITTQQFHVLLQLMSAQRPVPINRLADDLGLSVAATGRNVEKLVQLHLVDRREDGHDRRIKNLTITEPGRRALGEAIAGKHREVQALADELPTDLRGRLHDVLVEILALGVLPPNPLLSALKVNS